MRVLYYTSTPFLDIAIEKINILKRHVDLHVMIEVTPNSSDRIDIIKIPDKQIIVNSSVLLSVESYKTLEPYFDGCASTNFIVHASKTGFSLSTIWAALKTWYFIKNLKPDIIHLEAVTFRSLGLVPFLFSNKKFFITVHDPIPHSGEKNWKVSFPRFLYLRIPYSKSYFFYSNFSKNQFEKYFKKDKYPKFVIRMYPYSYYKKFAKSQITIKKHILFFGRLSPYKGVNVLLNAMSIVFKSFPNTTLIIAGSREGDYSLDQDIIDKYKKQIIVLNRYIPNVELVTLIQEAKFVVCPYLDATQSGVLMAAYALDTPVIATKVGAFPEYIEHDVTGLLIPVNDPSKLAEAIEISLQNNYYETLSKNILEINKTKFWTNNKDIILNAYLS